MDDVPPSSQESMFSHDAPQAHKSQGSWTAHYQAHNSQGSRTTHRKLKRVKVLRRRTVELTRVKVLGLLAAKLLRIKLLGSPGPTQTWQTQSFHFSPHCPPIDITPPVIDPKPPNKTETTTNPRNPMPSTAHFDHPMIDRVPGPEDSRL